MSKIQLFHFTSLQQLPAILKRGISKGYVDVSPFGGFSAPCLTATKLKSEQGWVDASQKDKLQVRISVEIDENDPMLNRWSDIMIKHKAPKPWIEFSKSVGWYDSESWFVYMGVISSAMFTEVQIDNIKNDCILSFISKMK